MALPPRRRANRGSDEGHREPGFSPSMAPHMPFGSRGTPRGRNNKGTGFVAGAAGMPNVGPGRAAQRKMGMSGESYPSRQTPSGAPPADMAVSHGMGKERYGK